MRSRQTFAWIVWSCVVAVAPATAQGKLPLGFGGGTYTAAAGPRDTVESFDFAHAIAYLDREPGGDNREFTVLLLSNAPIDETRARDEGHLAEEAKAGRLRALQVRIADADGSVAGHAVYDRRGRTPLDAPEKARFVKTTFAASRIEGGMFFYPGPDASAEMQRGYTASFNARIRQGVWREPGQAAGSIVIGSRRFEATDAVMVEDDDETTAIVSSGPLEDPVEREDLASHAVQKGLAVLWVTVRNDGTPRLARCLGPGLPGGDAEAPTITWRREDWDSRVMRGRLATKAAPAGAACAADVYFAAGPWQAR